MTVLTWHGILPLDDVARGVVRVLSLAAKGTSTARRSVCCQRQLNHHCCSGRELPAPQGSGTEGRSGWTGPRDRRDRQSGRGIVAVQNPGQVARAALETSADLQSYRSDARLVAPKLTSDGGHVRRRRLGPPIRRIPVRRRHCARVRCSPRLLLSFQ